MAENSSRKKANVRQKSPPKSSVTTNLKTKEQRGSKKQLTSEAIQTVKDIVNLVKPFELSSANKLHTFQMMMLDDAIYNCYDSNAVLVEKAFSKWYVEYDENSPTSSAAKEFLLWNLKNLSGNQSVRSIARSAIEFKRDGLAPFEKMYERSYGEWDVTPSGDKAWKLAKLSYIHPITLYPSEPFVIAEGGRKVTHLKQNNSALRNSISAGVSEMASNKNGYIEVPMNKVTLMTYSATDSQPFGLSPFEACYTAWREKVLLQDLTMVGVSKDLSGTPIVRLSSDILNKAALDSTSPEGLMVAQVNEAVANLHAGDQASIVLPSNTYGENGSGVRETDIEFLGISGGGKNFDMEVLVEQRRKFIYSVFGASHLIAADSSGGYNQLQGQVAIHKHYVDRDISVIEEAFNNDIIPQLFRLNGWNLKESEIPLLRAGEIDPITVEEFTKGVQRVGAVGLIPRKPKVINEILSGMNIKYRVDENMSDEDLDKILTSITSRSGDGMSSGLPSGTGDSTGNNSAVNSDNKA